MLRATEVIARLEGSRGELFAIVADVARYQSWVPGIERSQVLTREGDVIIAEIRVPGWADRSFNLELVLSPPTSIAFHQIDSLDRPEISGRIELGSTDPEVGSSSVQVRLTLRLETPFFRPGLSRRMRSTLRGTLDTLGARRRQLAAARRDAPTTKQKVLEVVREARGLKVWYMGETFRMPKVEAGEQ